MLKPKPTPHREVTLPDGVSVQISDTPEGWWTEQNASGYIGPHLIAPDLDNPRKWMNPGRLAELHASIRARGVRQPLIVTPRSHAPWVRVAPEHAGRFFAVVSGHRRQSAALETGLLAVPVKVVIYPSEKEHRMDMSLLNKGQDDLTDLEEGFEIVRLRGLKWHIQELCDAFGYKPPQLYARIHLTQLHPDLQVRLDPALPRDRRLGTTTGGAIGGVKAPTPTEIFEFAASVAAHVSIGKLSSRPYVDRLSEDDRRFALQKLLFEVIRSRSMSTERAIEFIRDRTLRFINAHGANAGPKTERYQPRRRKDILENLAREVEGSVVVDWPPEEMRRVFELSTREEVEDFIGKFKSASAVFARLIQMLERVRDVKRPMHPEVAKALAGRDKAHT